jgi:hypothetical protein
MTKSFAFETRAKIPFQILHISKKPFPSTKPVDHLKAGTSYFGITTNHQDWFYNAQLGTNGRLKTTYSKPTTSIEIFGQTIPDHESWPKILTYLPTDNYWLYQPRSQKMGILDELLGQIFEKEYEDNLKKLTKVIESKNRIIRHYRETGDTGDKTLIKILEADLVKYSLAIWKLRQKFFSGFTTYNISFIFSKEVPVVFFFIIISLIGLGTFLRRI